MGVVVSTKFFRSGRQDKKVGNHCSRQTAVKIVDHVANYHVANDIKNDISMLKSLHDAGFNKEYLINNLIAFCSDGASVMLGRNSGVGARLKKDFLNIVIWHCLNHCLQLALDDSVNDIKQMNHFKIFMDKIYTIFHQSNKNQMQLYNISEKLGLEILKIGRVLGPRWAACSLRSATAVWRAYPALYKYFSTKKKHSGMASRLCNKNIKALILPHHIVSLLDFAVLQQLKYNNEGVINNLTTN